MSKSIEDILREMEIDKQSSFSKGFELLRYKLKEKDRFRFLN